MGNAFRLSTLIVLTLPLHAQGGWKQVRPTVAPPARGFHAYCYDAANGVVVAFGGWDGRPQNDTWTWDGTNWTLHQPPAKPPARCCHTMAYDFTSGRVVMFGGTDGSAVDFDDTWTWDGTNWTSHAVSTRPSPRRAPVMSFDPNGGGIVLFGGGRGSSGQPVYDDTWTWDGSSWTLRQPATKPPARWSQAMTHDFSAGHTLMHGGAAGGVRALDDTWSWDGQEWTQHYPRVSPPPSARSGIAYDATSGVSVLFGGFATVKTWVWDGEEWMFDPRLSAPSDRSTFALAHDLARARTVCFGGSPYDNETWEYDASALARWRFAGDGCRGSRGVPTLTAAQASYPRIGSTFVLDLRQAPDGPAAIAIGLSDQNWGGRTLPWELTSIGAGGCTLRCSLDFPIPVTVSSGLGQLSWSIPNLSALIGIPFFSQALVPDAAANALGVVLSDAGSGRIGS